jgi:KaiC/GvpD/RAD55 family RecA-like ATPase
MNNKDNQLIIDGLSELRIQSTAMVREMSAVLTEVLSYLEATNASDYLINKVQDAIAKAKTV